MNKISLLFTVVGVSLILLIIFSPTYRSMIRYGFSDIDDHRIFTTRELQASRHPYLFNRRDNWDPPAVEFGERKPVPLELFLNSTSTVAFLVIKNDTLLYERYFAGYRRDSLVTAFSITKAVLSMLVGIAIDDGFIRSIKQPVTDVVPELRSKGYAKLRIEHLLQMTAGMDYCMRATRLAGIRDFTIFRTWKRRCYRSALSEIRARFSSTKVARHNS